MTTRTPQRCPSTPRSSCPDTADTEALGEQLAAGLRAGDLVVLAGPLGAGKTALVRGLARGLRRGRPGDLADVRDRPRAPARCPAVPACRWCTSTPTGSASRTAGVTAAGADVAAELDDLDLDTDLAGAVVAVEWGEGVAERLAARHLLVRLDRRPDDVRVADRAPPRPAPDPHRDRGSTAAPARRRMPDPARPGATAGPARSATGRCSTR